MDNIRVLVADDNPQCRMSVEAYLSVHEDLEVVGEARDGREAAALYRELSPDVVVMDVYMPECDGLEGTLMIRSRDPEARVVMLSAHDEPAVRERSALNGAVSFVAKHEVIDRLVSEIRRVASA